MGTTWESARARVAALSRDRKNDDPVLIEARRDFAASRVLAAERLTDHVRKVADTLTEQERVGIVDILIPGGAR